MRKLTGRGLKTLSARPMSSKWLELRCEPRFTWLWTLQSFMCIILATEGWKESALDLLSLLFLANTRQSSFSYTGGEAVVQIDLLMSCLLRCFSCLTLCNPMDCSPPGSSVHGILQARTLEWVAISLLYINKLAFKNRKQPKADSISDCVVLFVILSPKCVFFF